MLNVGVVSISSLQWEGSFVYPVSIIHLYRVLMTCLAKTAAGELKNTSACPSAGGMRSHKKKKQAVYLFLSNFWFCYSFFCLKKCPSSALGKRAWNLKQSHQCFLRTNQAAGLNRKSFHWDPDCSPSSSFAPTKVHFSRPAGSLMWHIDSQGKPVFKICF